MFRSLGFFSQITCPSTFCSLQGCLYQHSDVGESARPRKRSRLENDPGTRNAEPLSTSLTSIKRPDTKASSSLLLHEHGVQTRGALPKILSHAESQTRKGVVSKQNEAVQEVKKPPINSVTIAKPVTQASSAPADSRYISKATAPEISLRFDPTCPVPHESRLHYLRLFKAQFERIYAPLSVDTEHFQKLVHEHAYAQEQQILAKNGKGTYKQGSRNVLIKLTKRKPSIGKTDIGIHPEYTAPIEKVQDWGSVVHPVKVLEQWGYTTQVPVPDNFPRNEESCDRVCDRCGQRFIVSSEEDRWLTCSYHPGKTQYIKKGGGRINQWTCCSSSEGPGCTTASSHVFKITHAPRLAAYEPYVLLPRQSSQERSGLEVVALDCEMIYTTASMELARVSITSDIGEILLDEYVVPGNKVLDLNTRFSGIKEGDLQDKGITRASLFQKMEDLGINGDTIMVGHGLENDLTALRLVHLRVVDSAILFPHPRGPPYRNALKYLTKRYLSKDIQMNPVSGEGQVGHDPAEDARSALELVIWKMSHGDETCGDTPFVGKLK